MGFVLTAEERLREAQREMNRLRMGNLDLMEMIAEQECYICLLELGVSYDDL